MTNTSQNDKTIVLNALESIAKKKKGFLRPTTLWKELSRESTDPQTSFAAKLLYAGIGTSFGGQAVQEVVKLPPVEIMDRVFWIFDAAGLDITWEKLGMDRSTVDAVDQSYNAVIQTISHVLKVIDMHPSHGSFLSDHLSDLGSVFAITPVFSAILGAIADQLPEEKKQHFEKHATEISLFMTGVTLAAFEHVHGTLDGNDMIKGYGLGVLLYAGLDKIHDKYREFQQEYGGDFVSFTAAKLYEIEQATTGFLKKRARALLERIWKTTGLELDGESDGNDLTPDKLLISISKSTYSRPK